ncbi:2,3-dihydro-2,3-dihydroxybenzoate dehydrogenase [Paenibacillus sp. N1-5-1-14]|uniref:2,3-dihydro-2,3-dihydroxybenzoate dehydrogenase n=1 Tax=Paenibacillus radicibacter TaxID=2972488 RepID=UPI00215906FC|nr:2,3-dihydro-2,3-dihydroxybenzoate dehydrogenase [Paenibacillus radicibacter]MCR8642847.1 2,3-dihydro-2,3-dihydroxybenzoate dehydrogenase [Paenibacillus radicibacter]
MKLTGIEGKVALVTGAAQGIGSSVARLLAELGAVVAAVDRHADKLDEQVAQWRELGFEVTAYPLDVSDSLAVEQIVERIEQELGPISILANVAGVLKVGEIATFSDTDWETTFAVNVNGVFYVSRAVVRCMARRKAGAIVTVASNAAGMPRMQMGAYCASKAASLMLTKCLALEHAKDNIRCNVVSPGSTDTEMLRLLWADASGEQATLAGVPEAYRLGIPLGKLASPTDIAEAVVYLVSDQASHMTMNNLIIDGGATLGL